MPRVRNEPLDSAAPMSVAGYQTYRSFVTQPLGGYYGGRGVLDATVAHVLANALPLRTLHIPGKGIGADMWLDEAEVADAGAAGRWRRADYARLAADALIGTTVDEAALEKLAEAASAACRPIDDKRGTKVYRIKVAGVMARRAAEIALDRARSR